MKASEVFDESYSKYYNLLYADKDYSKEVGYISQLIKTFSPGATTIVEYGSGTGGHGLLLQQMGYTIVGLERSAQMASIARSKGFDCIVENIVSYNLERAFDVCLALFHVISYINYNEDLEQLFQRTHKHLNEGGLFIFDVWFTPAVLFQRPEIREKKIENDEIEVMRIARPVLDHIRNVVEVNYDVSVTNKITGRHDQFKEVHSMRHFGIQEMDLLAQKTGFTILRSEEFLTGNPPSENTWGVNFILQKK